MAIERRHFMTAMAGSAFSAVARAAPPARNFQFDPNYQHMMPAHFGRRLTGKASAEYLDVTTMAVSYLTDPVKLAQYLPEPFEVGSEPRVTVFYSMNHEIEWLAGGNYNLLGVNAAVRFNGKTDRLEGAYCLVLWEDETDPILTGRELLGIPKIYADIEDPAILRGTWRTSASHRNHKIVDMTIRGLKPLPAETIAAFKSSSKKANWMGWKYIPNTGRGGAAVSHATLVPTSASPREAWTGTGEIDWNRLTWEQNPTQAHIVNALADLPVLEYGPAFVSRGATGLRVPGRQVKELH